MPSARSTVSTSRRRVRRQEPRLGDARILETGHSRGAWWMRTTRSKQRGRPRPAQYRQGDVLLCRVSKVHFRSPVPPDADGRLVIAEGEHSGHAHALAPERAQLFRRGRQLRLSVGADGTALSHEEHSPILISQAECWVSNSTKSYPASARIDTSTFGVTVVPTTVLPDLMESLMAFIWRRCLPQY